MGVTEADARAALADFKRSIPGVESWKERVVREARSFDPPHVVTIAGRRRYLPALAAGGGGGGADERRGKDERKARPSIHPRIRSTRGLTEVQYAFFTGCER